MSQFPKKCPKCKTVNRGFAVHCKCGHEFKVATPKKDVVQKIFGRKEKALALTCPECHLVNNRSLSHCTCGYHFKQLDPSSSKRNLKERSVRFSRCPSCNLELRIAPSMLARIDNCPACKSPLREKPDVGEPAGRRDANLASYRQLGLLPGVSHEEVRKAYLKIMAMYHPDKVAGLGTELRELAEKKTLEANAAYRKIMSVLPK